MNKVTNKTILNKKRFPINKEKITITSDSNSFVGKDYINETEIPIENHVGAFGVKRKFHYHEGVDLYCPEGEPVYAMEDGILVNIEDFTGPKANLPWWNDTQAVHVEGESGVILYGEIEALNTLVIGQEIKQGDMIGHVKTVLKKDKGRPMSMLHLELYKHGNRKSYCWDVTGDINDSVQPEQLKNPTDLLLSCL